MFIQGSIVFVCFRALGMVLCFHEDVSFNTVLVEVKQAWQAVHTAPVISGLPTDDSKAQHKMFVFIKSFYTATIVG